MERGNSGNIMWTVLLCFMGLHICQVAGQEKSTQMYYMTLTIDKSALNNVTDNLLKNFITTEINANVTVKDLKMTTNCIYDSKVCHCELGYEWSKTACESQYKCCGNDSCKTQNYTCVSNKRVIIYGSLELKNSSYQECLEGNTTEKFKNCNNRLTEQIKSVYSYIPGFESVIITKYRVGSVIADFEVVIISPNISILQNKSLTLVSKLDAKLNLVTTGVVLLIVPKEPVNFRTDVNLTCKTETDLNSTPTWQLQNNVQNEIYNGTQSTIRNSPQESTIQLKNTSQLWTGTYTCTYLQNLANVSISHKGTDFMDVCIEPQIDMRSIPAYPRCIDTSTVIKVTIICEVEQLYEKYTVTWIKNNDPEVISDAPQNTTGTLIFRTETYIGCSTTDTFNVKCKLTNRCNQTVESNITINKINVHEDFCPDPNKEWEDTKKNSWAQLKCSGSVGYRKRFCNSTANWENPKINCVALELHDLQHTANNVDIGLGKLDTNAANVFNLLYNVTNKTDVINSAANIYASVNVLNTMSTKLTTIGNETTTNDFLMSSSNLLDNSLTHSWTNDNGNNNNTIAEQYLFSVEKLIRMANVPKDKKEPNLHVISCNKSQESNCSNTVFNVSVSVTSNSDDLVKTTGFQQLDKILPNIDTNYNVNSIVVSSTIGNKSVNNVQVEIDFQLFNPRPRNVELKCVFWNYNTSSWSDDGCTWVGDSDKGRCQCSHLSSFALLMSKNKLTLPYINEVTYVGLSVSISLLIICLVVELIVWSDVVKSDTLYLRHCAHVNIDVCLLVADICFLASNLPGKLDDYWCVIFVVLEHFFYLAMFFWMLSLSSILLHKTVYLSLDGVSKTAYFRFSVILGYVCPLLIVAITVLLSNGKEGQYYDKETRWLVYNGMLKGTIYTFILPVGIIVFLNGFFMILVILKLLKPFKASEMVHNKEQNSAKTVVRSVILLTPVFGLTWLLGFAVISTDLTSGVLAYMVNYVFVIVNAFQGLFIFLTTCVGDRMVRDALRRYFKKGNMARTSISNSSISSTVKK